MIFLDFYRSISYAPVGKTSMLQDMGAAHNEMSKRTVRKVTKQLPARAFSDKARKLLYTKLRFPSGGTAADS